MVYVWKRFNTLIWWAGISWTTDQKIHCNYCSPWSGPWSNPEYFLATIPIFCSPQYREGNEQIKFKFRLTAVLHTAAHCTLHTEHCSKLHRRLTRQMSSPETSSPPCAEAISRYILKTKTWQNEPNWNLQNPATFRNAETSKILLGNVRSIPGERNF